MTDPFATLSQARQLATGSQLNIGPPDLAPRCSSEAELDRLVTNYYKVFSEDMSGDVSFLLQIRSDPEVEAFRRLIYNLRTATNHTDNPRASEAARNWRAQYSTPQDAAEALAGQLEIAFVRLGMIAVAVSRRPSDAVRWRDVLLIDSASVFSAVEVDLGLRFSDGNRKRMVRLVEKRLEVHPAQGDRRAVVAEYCVQEMISDRRPLPVTYDRVLDALGVLGKPGAVGVVLLAHSVAEIAPGLRGDAFVARVKETWRIAVNAGT